jgi:hypothetical protein
LIRFSMNFIESNQESIWIEKVCYLVFHNVNKVIHFLNTEVNFETVPVFGILEVFIHITTYTAKIVDGWNLEIFFV